MVAAVTSTVLWGNTYGLAWYYLAIHVATTLWGFRILRTEAPGREAPAWLFATAAFLAVAAAFRFYQLGSSMSWCDEDWHNMRLPRESDIVGLAAWVHHPPTHYYLSRFAMGIFGRTLFAIRLFPAILSSLSVPLLFTLLLRVARSPRYAIAGALAMTVSIWMVSYGQEAKPYSAGIFYFFLYLHALYEFLALPRSPKAVVSLLATTLLFLLSVGLVPLILAYGCLAALAVYFAARGRWARAGLLAAVGLAAGLLFVPFQISLFGTVGNLVHAVRPLDWFRFHLKGDVLDNLANYRRLLMSGLYLLLPAPVLFFGFSLAEIRHRRHADPRLLLRACILCVSAFFPAVFLVAYGLVIQSPLDPRYVLPYVPLLLCSIAFGLESVELFFRGWFRRRRHYVSGICSGVLLLVTGAYVVSSVRDPSQKPHEYKWKYFFDFVNRNNPRDAEAFVFTLSRAPKFSFDAFLLTDFYYTPEMRRKFHLRSNWDVFEKKRQGQIILEELETGREPSDIYFFYVNVDSEVPFSKLQYSADNQPTFSEVEWPWTATYVRLPNRHGFSRTLEKFLLDVDAQEPDEARKFQLYEVLAGIYAFRKDCRRAVANFAKVARCEHPPYGTRGNRTQCPGFDWLKGKLLNYCPSVTREVEGL
jgi:hypothetical protein